MLTMLRGSTPALLRSGTTHLAPAAPAATAVTRRLRTVTRFQEEERPNVEHKREMQQAAQKQQQQQRQSGGMEQAESGEQQQGPGAQGSSQMMRRGQGGQMQQQGQGQGRDLMLPPSFRRFNESLSQIQREMDMVMNHFFGDDMLRPFPFDRALGFGGLGLPSLASVLPSPAELEEALPSPALIHMDFHEDDKEYALTAEVPGFSKEHVKASLSPEGILTIQGELKEEDKGDGKRKMSRFTSFKRSFRLPNDANLDGIHVQVKDGVAQVVVPKQMKKEEQHRQIEVK